MMLNFKEMSFFDYLFGYFGAHPHSIVMFLAWLDYKFFDGSQVLMASVSYASTMAFALFSAYLFFCWAKRNKAPLLSMMLGGAVIASLSTSLADWQVMTIPFHCVLSVSRLFYLVLLWALLKNLRNGSGLGMLTLTLVACLATTFHGTGLLFSIIYLLLTVLVFRGWLRIFIGVFPVITWSVQSYFYKIGGEVDSLSSVFSFEGLADLSKSFFMYFSTPLAPLFNGVDKYPFFVIGFILVVLLVWLVMKGMLNVIKARSLSGERDPGTIENIYAGTLSLLLLLSGLAASALMVVRTGSLADAYVLITARYVAYALISYSLAVCFLVKIGTLNRSLRALSMVGLLFLAFVALYPSVTFSKNYQNDVILNRAVALISSGSSPLEPTADSIWLNAKGDWYWVNALPRTVMYMKEEKLGPWADLPSLGQAYIGLGGGVRVRDVIYSDFDSSCHNISYFKGVLQEPPHRAFSRSGVAPVLDMAKKVIGFSSYTNNSGVYEVEGFVVDDSRVPTKLISIGPLGKEYSGDGKLMAIAPYNLTDQTWLNGVARNWPGFFVEDSEPNRKMLTVGRVLRFPDGSYQSIERQIIANGFLNIHTDNPIKNGEAVGFPKKIKVLGWCNQ
ncbi:hypothetical protein [Chitiniphilus eburneus]|uniref:Uncharacterized protein n=1 Tax=Chitiniphilus eburneus TaxID=2571148 RepID=A0A4V5MU41_9NEIS|nr:hypothetical protein [Chitiniphilus eburneus]TJZ78758.1 hypothetical protein FAZ21_00245 [Chitiniphilus eburneus]